MKPFMNDSFLLSTSAAERLYFDYAAPQPIFDYHCHLPPKDVAENRQFNNLAEIWLAGDHYKWRVLRTAGVDEQLITGNADDYDKYLAWAAVVPKTLGNPIYHWTHLELSALLVSKIFNLARKMRKKSGIRRMNCWLRQSSQPAVLCSK